jgi:hypothetical protein
VADLDTEGDPVTVGQIGRFTDSRHDLGSVRPSRWVDQPDVRRRVRLSVAAKSTGVEDCRDLLGALGLGPTPEEIADWRAAVDVGPTETPSRNDEETTER